MNDIVMLPIPRWVLWGLEAYFVWMLFKLAVLIVAGVRWTLRHFPRSR